MKIRKAVIPAAGFGTRMLPISKSIPKEMLPLVDKPAIQWIVEEAVQSGISDILIIVSRGKTSVEDHFDRGPELESFLENTGKMTLLREMEDISRLANIHFLRQQVALGLGHAVLLARSFVGEEPFAVLYGDDVVVGQRPATLELCEAFEEYGKSVVGIKPVSPEELRQCSSLAVSPLENNRFAVSDMIEKPLPEEALSPYAIMGRCLLTPEIFTYLAATPKGVGGELQLTDAMKQMARSQGMIGVEYGGKRYDTGNKLNYIQANVELALAHPEIGPAFREYLRTLPLD